jgi:hypothetical protein
MSSNKFREMDSEKLLKRCIDVYNYLVRKNNEQVARGQIGDNDKEKVELLDEIIQILNTRKIDPELEHYFLEIKNELKNSIDPLRCRCDAHNSFEVVGISTSFLGDVDKERETKEEEKRVCENGFHHIYGRRIMKHYRKFLKTDSKSNVDSKSNIDPKSTNEEFLDFLKQNLNKKEIKKIKKNLIIYYTREEAQKWTAYFKNGKIYPTNKERENFKSENYIFVWDKFTNDFFVAKKRKGKVQHTSFTNGCPVSCAGFLTLDNGRITHIKGHSGHYTPNKLHMLEFKKFLFDHIGSDVKNIVITLYNGEQICGPIQSSVPQLSSSQSSSSNLKKSTKFSKRKEEEEKKFSLPRRRLVSQSIRF